MFGMPLVTWLWLVTKILEYNPETITGLLPPSYRKSFESKLQKGLKILSNISSINYAGSAVDMLLDAVEKHIVSSAGSASYWVAKEIISRQFTVDSRRYMQELPKMMGRVSEMLEQSSGNRALDTHGALGMIEWCEQAVQDSRIPKDYRPSEGWIAEMKRIKMVLPYMDSPNIREATMEMFSIDGIPVYGPALEFAKQEHTLLMMDACSSKLRSCTTSKKMEGWIKIFHYVRQSDNNANASLVDSERDELLRFVKDLQERETELKEIWRKLKDLTRTNPLNENAKELHTKAQQKSNEVNEVCRKCGASIRST
jgi:hypothetical protein